MYLLCWLCRLVDLPVEQSNNNNNNSSQSSEEEEEDDEEGEEGIGSGEEALMQAFGETAVQGVTWLVNAMGLNVNQPNGTAAASNGATDQQQPPTQPLTSTKVWRFDDYNHQPSARLIWDYVNPKSTNLYLFMFVLLLCIRCIPQYVYTPSGAYWYIVYSCVY